MGFMPYVFWREAEQNQKYSVYVELCRKRNEEPLSREEWDKREAKKKQPLGPPQEPPYSDYMR